MDRDRRDLGTFGGSCELGGWVIRWTIDLRVWVWEASGVLIRRVGWVFGLGMAGCIGAFDADRYTFLCSANRDCGAGYRCVAGECVAADAVVETEVESPAAEGTVCVAERTAMARAGGATFRMEASGELIVEIDGVVGTFVLPADEGVLGLAEDGTGPLSACCENACCFPREVP